MTFQPPVDHPEYAPVRAAADAMAAHFGAAPRVLLLLGSGLGPLVKRVEAPHAVGYGKLGLPQSKVIGHAGELVVGTFGGKRVGVMSGRVHLYEGWSPAEVVRWVRAAHLWGVQSIVLSASVGTLSRSMAPGDLVLVHDQINFQGCSPLVGPTWGTRFPDASVAYDEGLRAVMHRAADATGVALRDGVYAAMLGPAYETRAEIRMLRQVGADVVGMSTVPEVLAASEVGLKVAALAVVSNYANGVVEAPVDHTQVVAVASKAAARMTDLLAAFVAEAG